MYKTLKDTKVLVTGGAGFIGSNLVEALLNNNNQVVVLDNFATGFRKNIEGFMDNPDFRLIEGDIRNPQDCEEAVKGVKFVFHQAALGSVPRSIKDPRTSNEVNVSGFINMIIAARDAGVKRFIYAASSSTYGDSKKLPKVEDKIGKPLSPYAITKYVNELYAEIFSNTYGIETIGLRYFNVFGRKQDPNGAYAAVIPLWVSTLLKHEAPVINGDGTYSRDFTYIDNVIQANMLAAVNTTEEIKARSGDDSDRTLTEVFNVAFGGNTTLKELYSALKDNLSELDPEIGKIDAIYGPNRAGDIPHSQASIDKAKNLLGYNPQFDARKGFEKACQWYFDNLK
jgi:UDP-N-acetylglucosamine 4-epimerase